MRSSIVLNRLLSSSIASRVLAHGNPRVGPAGRDDVADGADQPFDRPHRRSRDDEAAGEAPARTMATETRSATVRKRASSSSRLSVLLPTWSRVPSISRADATSSLPAAFRRAPDPRRCRGRRAARRRSRPIRRHADEQRLGAAADDADEEAFAPLRFAVRVDGAGDGAEPAARIARRVLAQRRGDDLAIALAPATRRAARRSAHDRQRADDEHDGIPDASRSPKRPLPGVGRRDRCGLGTSVGLQDVADAAHGLQPLRLEVAVDLARAAVRPGRRRRWCRGRSCSPRRATGSSSW